MTGPLHVSAEVGSRSSLEEARGAGADALRVDADALVVCSPAFEALQDYLLLSDAHARHERLEELTALLARAFAGLAGAASGLELTVALGSRPADGYLPGDEEAVRAAAARTGLKPGAVARRVEEARLGHGLLGVRGARWLLQDPRLFAALVRGLVEGEAEVAEAAGRPARLALLLPAVAFPGELRAARRLLGELRDEVAADFGRPFELRLVAGLESARAVLDLGRLREDADAVEYDLAALTATVAGLWPDDAARFLPGMVEQEFFPADPFQEADPPLAQLLALGEALARGAGRPVPSVVRGPQLLRSSGLELLGAADLRRVSVPPGAVAELRRAFAARPPAPGGSTRCRQLLACLSTPLAEAGAAPPSALPVGERARDFLEGLVARVDRSELRPRDVLGRVPCAIVDALARPLLVVGGREPTAVGLGVSPGCGVGRISFSPEHALGLRRSGEPYVLVVQEAYGEEANAVREARGLVSLRGGRTSHAAMVAANSDVPCVIDDRLRLDLERRTVTLGETTLAEGDWLSLDGATGALYAGALPLEPGAASPAYARLMAWADEARRLRIKANADTPEDARRALANGAEGVGLIRTQNQLLAGERLDVLRAALVGPQDRLPRALERLEALQLHDYEAWFDAVGAHRLTFRLLDVPLSEFLPHDRVGVEGLAASLGLRVAEAARRVDAEQPVDALMGLRGARLAVVRPEIERGQVRALAGAWARVRARGAPLAPLRILVPMVAGGNEMAAAARRIRHEVQALAAACRTDLPLELGAMLELPRAALEADLVAPHVDFFAWGSNDLTQFALGLSRDAAPRMVPGLLAAGCLDRDPNATLDLEGPGRLIQLGEALGRAARPGLETGLCGGLGADPRSIRLFHRLGLDYVSVPPGQVATARLAAGQAALDGSGRPFRRPSRRARRGSGPAGHRRPGPPPGRSAPRAPAG